MREPCLLRIMTITLRLMHYSVVIHQTNLRSLLIEVYKIHSKISPAFICDLISESECIYQTRSHYKITENTDGAISEKKLMIKIPQVHKVLTDI